MPKFFLLMALFILSTLGGVRLPTSQGYSLTQVDVGQGDAYWLQFLRTSLFFDGGSVKTIDGLRRFLRNSGAPDIWVLTHFDEDHVGAMKAVVDEYTPKEIWISRFDRSPFSTWLQKKYANRVKVGGRSFCDQQLCVTSFHIPPKKGAKRVTNSDSLIVLVFRKVSREGLIILAGDLEFPREDGVSENILRLVRTPPLVLKIAHHGSKSSTREGWMEKLPPKVALIPAGRANLYRFPHQPVLNVLDAYKVMTLRNDALGKLKVDFDFY